MLVCIQTLLSINIQVTKADISVQLYTYNGRNVLLAVRARVCVLSLSFFPYKNTTVHRFELIAINKDKRSSIVQLLNKIYNFVITWHIYTVIYIYMYINTYNISKY